MQTISGIHGNDQQYVKGYFSYYAKLASQQNMMSDEIRTKAYYDAIMQNE